MLVGMPRRFKPCNMGIAFKRPVVKQFDISGDSPSGEGLRELKRAVFNLFRIKTAVGGIIDILKNNPYIVGDTGAPFLPRSISTVVAAAADKPMQAIAEASIRDVIFMMVSLCG